MTDLRDLLRQAAGRPPTAVPMAGIRHRATVLARRRRTVTGVLIAVLVVIIGVTAVRYHPATDTPLTPAPRPSPVVTPGILPPGTYVTRTLSPKVTFTIPDGSPWRVSLLTANSLVLNSDSLAMGISLQRWTAVHLADPDGTIASAPSARPPDVIAWLAHHPALITGKPAATTFGGRPAHAITFTLDPHRRLSGDPAVGCTLAADCVDLAETPDNAVIVYSVDTTTVIADDGPNGLVLTMQPRTGTISDTTPLPQIRAIG